MKRTDTVILGMFGCCKYSTIVNLSVTVLMFLLSCVAVMTNAVVSLLRHLSGWIPFHNAKRSAGYPVVGLLCFAVVLVVPSTDRCVSASVWLLPL